MPREPGPIQRCYDRYLMPRLVNFACASPAIARRRARIVPTASGVVVEVGLGSGQNLAHYDPDRVTRVIGVDPVAEMTGLAAGRMAAAPVPVELLSAGAEAMPLPSNHADTVVLMFTGCTIPDLDGALAEMARVLRPSGRLLFCEHGLAPEPRVARWQHRLNGAWRRLAGGCNLNRDIVGQIERAGFRVGAVRSSYLSWTPRFLGFVSAGSASLR